MTDEERIAAIEAEVARLDKKIDKLTETRDSVLLSDEEYASYVAQYRTYYDDEPLGIQEYYELDEELAKLNDEIMAADDEEFETLWRKHERRIAYLERRLAA